jgi:HK97 family phage prohead protease
MILKTAPLELVAVGKVSGRIRITTPSLDRDRDRVLPMGGQLEAYMKNPVVQWGHQYYEPWQTIGKTTALEVSPSGIDATFELREPANESDPQHIVLALWEQQLINTASIGFQPLTATPNDAGGVDFTSWELYEFSLVPIPANRDAVRLAFDAYPLAAKSYGAAMKAGRVLSKANEAKLREAYAAIGAVLEQLAGGDMDEDDEQGKALAPVAPPAPGTPPEAAVAPANIDRLTLALRAFRAASTRN